MVKKTPQIEIIQNTKQTNNIFRKFISKKTNIAYFIVFIAILTVAFFGSNALNHKDEELQVKSVAKTTTAPETVESLVVDNTIETLVVANLAENAKLAIAPSAASASVSLAVMQESSISESAAGVIEKPKILEVSSSRREIVVYKTTAEETIQSIADKYGITAQTIKWVNKLKGDKVEAGKEVRILPVDGIVYTLKDGEKLSDLATKYQASLERILSYNNLEDETKAKAGQELVIPGGILPETERPDYVAPVTRTYTTSAYSGGSASASSSYVPANYNVKAGNAYAYGYCTGYAYNRRPDIGSFWGNATSWAAAARAAGYTVVRGVPQANSIFQYGGGYGHVGIVESVDFSAGTMVISDMNGIAGWGRAGTATVNINPNWNYIY